MSQLRQITKKALTITGRLAAVAGGTATVAALTLVAWLETAPAYEPDRFVEDVTRLVNIPVDLVVRPRTVEEVRRILSTADAPISLGGGRFSMGGQIATEGTLFLDLRDLNNVEHIDPVARTARVQAGITWKALIAQLDPHDLSPKIMQSYANFTVGGSLSVNAHGRYVNQGPLVHAVREIDVVLADGSLVTASRDVNPDLFWVAVGGYGAVGVIVAVDLDLAPNFRVERRVERMRPRDFSSWFDKTVRPSTTAVFFNADIYPPAYDDLVAITYEQTGAPVTELARVQPGGRSTPTDHLLYWWVSEAPLGKQARSDLVERMRLQNDVVVWRNWEASYDVAALEPGSRATTTYVLAEYFIPVSQFDSFLPKMTSLFDAHDVNVINVSIRHANAEPDSLLTWAPEEVFAFVVYYKQGTSATARAEVGAWTREMTDAVLSVGGRYYLPYQPHATTDQFHATYPRANEWFERKRALDPAYKFRNRLLDTYFPPTPEYGDSDHAAFSAALDARASWPRPEGQTFLTLPEWMIVYNADELGDFLQTHHPSDFPYFASIGQFWQSYRRVWRVTRDRYDFNTGYHAMILVIGLSYTAEYAAKGLWENTVGRLFERDDLVPEEQYFAQVTADYGAFIHHTPWFAFPFEEKRLGLKSVVGDGSWRSTERQFSSGGELWLKSKWAAAMGGASAAAYGTETGIIEAWLRPSAVPIDDIPGLTKIIEGPTGNVLVSIPRYELFTATILALARRDVEIVEVSGCTAILVQVLAPENVDEQALWGDVVYSWPLVTDPTRKRITLEVPIRRLDEAISAFDATGVAIERLYDF